MCFQHCAGIKQIQFMIWVVVFQCCAAAAAAGAGCSLDESGGRHELQSSFMHGNSCGAGIRKGGPAATDGEKHNGKIGKRHGCGVVGVKSEGGGSGMGGGSSYSARGIGGGVGLGGSARYGGSVGLGGTPVAGGSGGLGAGVGVGGGFGSGGSSVGGTGSSSYLSYFMENEKKTDHGGEGETRAASSLVRSLFCCMW